jgi:hypothetical protein
MNKYVWIGFTGIMLLSCLLSGCHIRETPDPDNGPVQAIDPSQINVGGELRIRLMKNFDRLEEEKYQPHKVFLTEEESGWLPGDTEGRTILAQVKLARITNRTPLFLDSIIRLFPEKVNEKGYFGTIYPEGILDEQQLSSHGWVLRGLCEFYLWKKDPEVLSCINRIIDNLVLPTAGLHKNYPIEPSMRKHGGKQIGTRQNGKVGNWILSTYLPGSGNLPASLRMPKMPSSFISMRLPLSSVITVDLEPIPVPVPIRFFCTLIFMKPIGAVPCAVVKVWRMQRSIPFLRMTGQSILLPLGLQL